MPDTGVTLWGDVPLGNCPLKKMGIDIEGHHTTWNSSTEVRHEGRHTRFASRATLCSDCRYSWGKPASVSVGKTCLTNGGTGPAGATQHV
jgi:hypothetical protein